MRCLYMYIVDARLADLRNRSIAHSHNHPPIALCCDANGFALMTNSVALSIDSVALSVVSAAIRVDRLSQLWLLYINC